MKKDDKLVTKGDINKGPLNKVFKREIDFVLRHLPKANPVCDIVIEFDGDSPFPHMDRGTFKQARVAAYRLKKDTAFVYIGQNRLNFKKGGVYCGHQHAPVETISEAVVSILAHELRHYRQSVFEGLDAWTYGDEQERWEADPVRQGNWMLALWRGSPESRKVRRVKKSFEEVQAPETVAHDDFTSPVKKQMTWQMIGQGMMEVAEPKAPGWVKEEQHAQFFGKYPDYDTVS